MIDFTPPPKLWMPAKPAIIRAASLQELARAQRKASFLPGMFPAGAFASAAADALSGHSISTPASSGAAGIGGRTLRARWTAALFATPGTAVRITLKAGPSGATFSETYVGPRNMAGDSFDAEAFTQVTFGGAASTGALGNNAEAVSDIIPFTLDNTKDQIVSTFIAAGDVNYSTTGVSGFSTAAKEGGGNQASTLDLTGYNALDFGGGSSVCGVQLFEW